jgi:hypothetical protein
MVRSRTRARERSGDCDIEKATREQSILLGKGGKLGAVVLISLQGCKLESTEWSSICSQPQTERTAVPWKRLSAWHLCSNNALTLRFTTPILQLRN